MNWKSLHQILWPSRFTRKHSMSLSDIRRIRMFAVEMGLSSFGRSTDSGRHRLGSWSSRCSCCWRRCTPRSQCSCDTPALSGPLGLICSPCRSPWRTGCLETIIKLCYIDSCKVVKLPSILCSGFHTGSLVRVNFLLNILWDCCNLDKQFRSIIE